MLSALVDIPFDELVDRTGQFIFHLVDQLDNAELVQTLDKES